MKILILAPAYFPAIGGAESYAKTMAENLSARGHQVQVVTDHVDACPTSELINGVRVRRLSKYQDLLADDTKLRWEQMAFSLLPEIDEFISQDGGLPDVIFANANDTAIYGSMVSLALNRPLVCSFHEQEPERGPLGFGRSNFVYKHLPASAYLAGSRFYHQKALAHGANPPQVHLINHGVDAAKFKPTDSHTAPVDTGEFRILLSGRIAPRKQQTFAVELCARVRAKGVPARLILAGRAHSSDRMYYESLVSLIDTHQLQDHVSLLTDVSHDQMPETYQNADLVIQPSVAEGLGLAVIEAMLVGKPVMVSDTTGLSEIIVDDRIGVTLPPGDLEVWADAVAFLWQGPDLRTSLGAKAREHALQNYSVVNMVDETESLLKGVVQQWSRVSN
ncbi:MAG: glycosyltransferase family 4 protein [Paenarthrobacter ureafaciens]|uniref:glycosyltransferase family 4 protein n=1 Tax=Paenarthrobacter ureafaciens TaxID=37931 RepID=UPI001AC70549|nr:glycosyltransferase family 4 protein [Paenarthrobacter ureafaciens]MBN9131736.1 glycosyltransferase family 4 protein [Paenarthrobacter ureafaciens]